MNHSEFKQAIDEVAYHVWLDWKENGFDEKDMADYLYEAAMEGAKFYRDMGHGFEWDKESL